MSSFTVETVLHDLAYRPGVMDRFKSDPHAVLNDYPLTAQEQDDLVNWNVKSIADNGASAMLLMLCYTGLHGPASRKDYLRMMGMQGEDRTGHVY